MKTRAGKVEGNIRAILKFTFLVELRQKVNLIVNLEKLTSIFHQMFNTSNNTVFFPTNKIIQIVIKFCSNFSPFTLHPTRLTKLIIVIRRTVVYKKFNILI